MIKVFGVLSALLVSCLLSLVSCQPAFAHLAGQPPFFKINGVYSNLYPVPSTSLNNFNLPQDLAADNYLAGQTLGFEMDTNQLPVLPQVVNKTKFFWDFGDGLKSTGLKNSHVYSKMGSYILTIKAQYDTDQPQLIQSVLIHILPNKDYQLPQAIVKVNGQSSKDPLTDVIKLKFGHDFQFDGSSSTATSSQIVSYFWDFGDTKSSSEQNPSHRYTQDLGQVFPLLRVKDQNGFISDNFIEIENESLIQQNQTTMSLSPNQPKQNVLSFISLPLALTAILLLLIVGIYFGFLKKRKKFL